MLICLLNNKEAVMQDDQKEFITVEPRTDGVLSVEGDAYTVKGDGTTPVPPFALRVGAVAATFTTDAGFRYRILSPYVTGGVPVSRVNPFDGYVDVRRYVRELEEKLDETIRELRDLKGSIQHDSLGFMIK